eukprot:357926-Prymnesium_polylepis.1
MPKKRHAKGVDSCTDSEHEKVFYSWMRTALDGKVRVKQVNTAGEYEKMVLRANEWMVGEGYEPFCHVIE